jgi:hypothetical protein
MKFCLTCTSNRYVSFNWKYATEGKDKKMAMFASHFQLARPLKFGYLYECPSSHRRWFLDDDGANMYFVPAEKAELVERWDKEPLRLSTHQIQILSDIGGTEADKYGNGKGEIKIPCAIQDALGKLHDPTLIVITKMPPIQEWRRQIMLGGPDVSIQPSDFALPLSVRLATLNADELRMGFAPTLVRSSDDQRFLLNWSTQVFSYRHLKGQDISLPEESFDWHQSQEFPIIDENLERVTFLYYDWFKGCQKLTEQ